MNQQKIFWLGFRSMLPIIMGVIPFGIVMGVVSHEAQLTLLQTVGMNFVVFAGASQLAAVDLMSKNAAYTVVILTGLVINIRFLLYSAALSPVVQKSSLLTKVFCTYALTDQNYAVMSANQDKLQSNAESIQFYLGVSACMMLAWHTSVITGYFFGNFAPSNWSLEYAVPLSFVALVTPTLKNRKYVAVALFSSVVSLLFHSVPYKAGLIFTAILSMAFAAFISRPRRIP